MATPPERPDPSAPAAASRDERGTDVAEHDVDAIEGAATSRPAEPLRAETPDAADRSPEKKWGIGFWVATSYLVVLVLGCVLAPYLPFVEDPNRSVPGGDSFKAAPNADLWFGGDALGRDLFARVLHGGRISLLIAFAVTFFGFMVGGFFGVVAGYFRGRTDRVITSVIDLMLAFPALVLALALISVIGGGESSIGVVIVSLSFLSFAPLARITRASTLSFAEREFVTAARTLGARNRRIIRREILPNVIPPMAAFALVVVAIIIVAEGALSYLGLSVTSPTATWGKLIADGRADLENHAHIAIVPAAVMFLTIMALNYVGDVLRARYEVREGAL